MDGDGGRDEDRANREKVEGKDSPGIALIVADAALFMINIGNIWTQ